jgi:chemotaxis protein methyltransferase CheR
MTPQIRKFSKDTLYHYQGLVLDVDDFQFISNLVRQRFGVNLTDDKRALVAGRLQQMLRERNFPDFRSYRRFLETAIDSRTLDELVNRIVTNHTYFFREDAHFSQLRQRILPELKMQKATQGSRDLRFWCAASSSGEEAYTFIITLMEFFGPEYGQWEAGLLATDISAKALEMAKSAVYPTEKVKNVPVTMLRKYFQTQGDGNWTVRDFVRNEVTFRRFNLVNEKFPFRRPFDLILCRNVMIYFNQKTRDQLLQRLAHSLAPGGYLLIGHSESIGRHRPEFIYVNPAVYQRTQS